MFSGISPKIRQPAIRNKNCEKFRIDFVLRKSNCFYEFERKLVSDEKKAGKSIRRLYKVLCAIYSGFIASGLSTKRK